MTSTNEGALGKTLNAGRWTVINIVIQKSFSLVTFFILARLLSPADFGIFALVTIVPGFLYYFSSPSFGLAVVQSKEDNSSRLDALWTFNILRAIITVLVVFILGPMIAKFFHSEEHVLAIRLGGIFIFLQALANIGELYFSKEMDFKKLFIRDLASRGFYAITAIAIGIITHSYWALFIASAVLEGTGSIMTYLLSPYRPRLSFKFSVLKGLLPFGKWVYAQNILGRLAASIESMLVGRYASTTALGLYGKAHTLATIPSPIGSMVNKIGLPAVSLIQNDIGKIKEGVYKMFDIMLYITVPFVAIILFGGHRIILILLGEQWLEMEPLLSVLVVGMSINMVFFTLNEPVFNGIGKPKLQVQLLVFYTVIFVAIMLIAVPIHGAVGAAWAILVASLTTAILTVKKLVAEIGVSFKKIFSHSIITILSTTLVSIVGFGLLQIPIFNTTIGFCLLILMLAILYYTIIRQIYMHWHSGPQETINIVLAYFIKSLVPTSFQRLISKTLGL